MSAVVLVLCLSGYFGSALATYTTGKMSSTGTNITTTNAARSASPVSYVPLAQGDCLNKTCGEHCMVQGDMVGLCDVRGECSFNYEAVRKSCPPACGPVCAIHCPFGNVRNSASGCPTCQCNEPPTSTACPSSACRMHCEFGNVLDAAGCPTCECKLRFIVEGSLVLDCSNTPITSADVNFNVSFARAIAQVAGSSVDSVKIYSLSFQRRLSQFLTSSNISQRFLSVPVRHQIVNFTIDAQSRRKLDHMVFQLSHTSLGEMQAAIYQHIPGTPYQIYVVSITAAVVERWSPAIGGPSPTETRAKQFYLVLVVVALLICSTGCLLSVFTVFWILRRRPVCRSSVRAEDKTTLTSVVVAHDAESPQARSAISAVPDHNQLISFHTAKAKNVWRRE